MKIIVERKKQYSKQKKYAIKRIKTWKMKKIHRRWKWKLFVVDWEIIGGRIFLEGLINPIESNWEKWENKVKERLHWKNIYI